VTNPSRRSKPAPASTRIEKLSPCPLASQSPQQSVLCTPYSEIWLNLCTFAQAEGRFAPLHGIFAACPHLASDFWAIQALTTK
jgi:hypothetical protein